MYPFFSRHSLFANSHDRDVDSLPAHAGGILDCAGHGDFSPGQVRPEPLPDHSHQRWGDLRPRSQQDGTMRSSRMPRAGKNFTTITNAF